MSTEGITIISLAAAIVAVTLGLTYAQPDKTALANAGLEECPQDINYLNHTIWVKDCSKYLNTIETIENSRKD